MTPIQEFYDGKSIFVTGATGFLGKLLIEELLRSCPGVSRIYVLVRPKKNKDANQRIVELLENPLFSKLKLEQPEFVKKIIVINGDCASKDLGISRFDRAQLIEKVGIIFHAAATVRFDENLKIAAEVNVRGTKNLMNLCREMKRLKACIHISTAYSYCVYKRIDERFYDPPMDANELLSQLEPMDPKQVHEVTKKLLKNWPNTYTFTKALAEDLIRKESSDLPIAIIRPSIVTSTWKQPLPGWIDNTYGPTGVILGSLIGTIRSIRCDGSLKADMVPADIVVNSLIVCAWDVAQTKSTTVPIFNCVGEKNIMTWQNLLRLTKYYAVRFPLMTAVSYHGLSFTKSKILHSFYDYSVHMLPALVIDAFSLMSGMKPRMFKTYKVINKFLGVLEFFTNNEWTFLNERSEMLIQKISEEDRKLFKLDIREVNWETYCRNYVIGIRAYLMKDPLDTLSKAQVRYKKIFWIHQLVKLFITFAFLSLVWRIRILQNIMQKRRLI